MRCVACDVGTRPYDRVMGGFAPKYSAAMKRAAIDAYNQGATAAEVSRRAAAGTLAPDLRRFEIPPGSVSRFASRERARRPIDWDADKPDGVFLVAARALRIAEEELAILEDARSGHVDVTKLDQLARIIATLKRTLANWKGQHQSGQGAQPEPGPLPDDPEITRLLAAHRASET